VRADDPPAQHNLALSDRPPLLYVIPVPCRVSSIARRSNPCVSLSPPGASLCVSGVVGEGTIDVPERASFSIEAGRVTIAGAESNVLSESIEGYLRLDDPTRGLELVCPAIQSVEDTGPNARRLIALCSNRGEAGWAVAGQLTDGGLAAADSIGLDVYGPDGAQVTLSGILTHGAIIVRNPPAQPAQVVR
jgi:hypothetical protein